MVFRRGEITDIAWAFAAHTPILGRVAQGALELGLSQIRKWHFLSVLAFFFFWHVFSKKRCL